MSTIERLVSARDFLKVQIDIDDSGAPHKRLHSLYGPG